MVLLGTVDPTEDDEDDWEVIEEDSDDRGEGDAAEA
jgi:hypothetical protein